MVTKCEKNMEEFDEAITRRIDDLILIAGQQTLNKYKRHILFIVHNQQLSREKKKKRKTTLLKTNQIPNVLFPHRIQMKIDELHFYSHHFMPVSIHIFSIIKNTYINIGDDEKQKQIHE